MDNNTNKLQKRLESFGTKLTQEQCKEFRDILHDIASLYHTIADVYKYAEINLIPGKIQSQNITELERMKTEAPSNLFTPATKQNKGNPLAELLHNLSEADKAKLVGSLETNLKKD